MDAREIQAVLTYLADSRVILPQFSPGFRIASELIGAAIAATAEDTEEAGTDDAEAEDTEADEEDDEEEEEDAEEEDDEEEGTEGTEAEDDAGAAAADDTPQDKFRRGWNNRILEGEPEGRDYLFRRAGDGFWYSLRGRRVIWTDDRNSAESRHGMRAASATALGISTHAGSAIEVVDNESGVVVRRYASRRRVD